MVPFAGGIKIAMTRMCERAADLGFVHAEKDLGLQPRTFSYDASFKAHEYARTKKALFGGMDAEMDAIIAERAFTITGIAKEAVLVLAREAIAEYVAQGIGGGDMSVRGLEEALFRVLAPFLPEKDSAGRSVNKGARVETIVRTNTTSMYNIARYKMYTAPELRGWVVAFRYTAVMDNRTTELCRSLHGRLFLPHELDGYIPPNHFNCRSTIVPVTPMSKGWEEEYAAWQRVPKPPLLEGFGGPPGTNPIDKATKMPVNRT